MKTVAFSIPPPLTSLKTLFYSFFPRLSHFVFLPATPAKSSSFHSIDSNSHCLQISSLLTLYTLVPPLLRKSIAPACPPTPGCAPTLHFNTWEWGGWLTPSCNHRHNQETNTFFPFLTGLITLAICVFQHFLGHFNLHSYECIKYTRQLFAVLKIFQSLNIFKR